ncbi:MAG TPA: DUF1579 domain-containing protein [Candidatus Angelobacter sp.]|nr:DUF1579 domain-containing protein [Candidatus Angelobacter sp.]
MKANTKASIFGSVLIILATAGISALGQAAPGPEHEALKKLEGTWNAKMKMGDTESAATATYKMICGGMWLMSDFQGEFGDQKFSGHGMDGYDAEKKKFVSVWVDSMSGRPLFLEGTHDKEKKTTTMTGEAMGPDGKMAKHKMVTQMSDDDHFTFTMFALDADGKENKVMTIEYTRKK